MNTSLNQDTIQKMEADLFQMKAATSMAKETHEFSMNLLKHSDDAVKTQEITEKYQFRLTMFMDCTKTFNEYSQK